MLVPSVKPVKWDGGGNTILPSPVRRENLKFQVARIVQEAIFGGQLHPGQVLRELSLARQLNVSQATIREAFAHLQQLGLLVKEPNRGTSVVNLSPAEVRDRLSVRIVLEELAAAEAATRMSNEDLGALENLAQDIVDTIGKNQYFETSQADIAFHRFIWEKSGNAILARTLDQLTTPLFAFLGVLHRITKEDQRRSMPHSEIIRALRTRDRKSVRAAVRAHIDGSYGVFLNSEAPDLHSLLDSAVERQKI